MALHKTLCFLRLYYFLAQWKSENMNLNYKIKKLLNLRFLVDKLANTFSVFLCSPFYIFDQCIFTKRLRNNYSLFLNITDPRWYVTEFNNKNDNFWVALYGVWPAGIKKSKSECKFRKLSLVKKIFKARLKCKILIWRNGFAGFFSTV